MNKTIEDIAIDEVNGWFEKAKWRRENRLWLRKSSHIALKILHYIDDERISKKEFAQKCEFDEDTVNEMVKGKYDFRISEIATMTDVMLDL